MVTWGDTTVFGGQQTPSAGTLAPSYGFSFGSSSAASATPGAASPAPSLFGANATAGMTPGFGLTSPTTSFGSTTPLFGTPSTTTNASPGIFGSNPTPLPSGFGSVAPSPGLFAASAAAAAPVQTHASSTAIGGYPQQAAIQAHMTAQRWQDAAHLESAILSLRAAYAPSSDRFQYVFYDPITPEQRHARMLHAQSHGYAPNQFHSSYYTSYPPKPPNLDAATWSTAQDQNPDPENYLPVLVSGAEALSSRLTAQQSKANNLASALAQLLDAINRLKHSSQQSQHAIQHATLEQSVLQKRLLALMRKVEIVRCMNLPFMEAERAALARVENLGNKVNELRGGGVKEQGEEYLRNLKGRRQQQPSQTLEEEYKAELYRVLTEHRSGLAILTSLMKKDLRDMKILKEEVMTRSNKH